MTVLRQRASFLCAFACMLCLPYLAKADSAPVTRESAVPAHAEDGLAQHRAKFFAERRADQRLQDLGWMLSSGNAPFCPEAPLSIGLQMQDARAFGTPEVVRRIVGRRSDFTVRTVASGSPAQDAGFVPNEAILAIDGETLAEWPVDPKRTWWRGEEAHDLILASLAADGEVAITVEGGTTRTVKGIPACATRYEMQTRTKVAMADGKHVRFGRNFAAFEYADDEFAAIIGHELAHNVLKHRELLEARGRKRKLVRLTEREADRLMPWLAANAGFAPDAALRFMNRWGPEHGGGLLRKRTHDGWDERAGNIAAEIPLVLKAMEEDGHADWKTRFRREITP